MPETPSWYTMIPRLGVGAQRGDALKGLLGGKRGGATPGEQAMWTGFHCTGRAICALVGRLQLR
jgi:hypothetical protein